MATELFLLYLVTWTFTALTPGPAVMCSVANATRYGFRASLAGIAGIQSGTFLLFSSVGLGLVALLETLAGALTVLRIVGAAYLFYLGLRIMIGASRAKGPPAAAQPPARHSLFLQGLLIQVTNPKTLIFISALLPHFLDKDRSIHLQVIVLVIATLTIDSIVLAGFAFVAQRGVHSFRTSRISLWFERVFGAALLIFGIRLLQR